MGIQKNRIDISLALVVGGVMFALLMIVMAIFADPLTGTHVFSAVVLALVLTFLWFRGEPTTLDTQFKRGRYK